VRLAVGSTVVALSSDPDSNEDSAMRSKLFRLTIVTGFFVALSLAATSARAGDPDDDWCGNGRYWKWKLKLKEPHPPKPIDPKAMVSLDTDLPR
jgi:hypothetical protein